MNAFVIGDTQFGVDVPKSFLRVVNDDGDRGFLELEVRGDADIFDRLSEGESWSWALYPPKFYLLGLPVPRPPANHVATLTSADRDVCDCALYLMTHNDVDDVEVRFHASNDVEVSGIVDLFGEKQRFRIRYEAK